VTADAAAPVFSPATLAAYREILGRYPERRAALMPTWVTSVASFYTMYWKEPKGRWHVQVCRNLSCALRGAREVQSALERRLGICDGERTADGRFSLEEVECLASCGTAPVLQINNADYHENLDVQQALALIERLARE
jgi:NADH-quinone oxidoreductase subunit E